MEWIKQLFAKKRVKFSPSPIIPPCTEKRWVIADIHGCFNTFSALLEQLHLSKNDQLFLLGDLIDRGPSSSKVIDTILELQKSDYQVFVLRGNHEQMLLDCALQEPFKLAYMAEKFNTTDLLQRKSKVKSKYLNFIQALPYYFELERHFLVHAGFNFKAARPFEEYDRMMWIRSFNPTNRILKGKYLIHGHVTYSLPIIQHHIASKQQVIPLDNGCVHWGSKEGCGSLLALELASWELKIQQNEDFKMVFGNKMAIEA